MARTVYGVREAKHEYNQKNKWAAGDCSTITTSHTTNYSPPLITTYVKRYKAAWGGKQKDAASVCRGASQQEAYFDFEENFYEDSSFGDEPFDSTHSNFQKVLNELAECNSITQELADHYYNQCDIWNKVQQQVKDNVISCKYLVPLSFEYKLPFALFCTLQIFGKLYFMRVAR